MKSSDYHKEYNLKRYHKRRKEYIDLLGSVCTSCGSPENLEFDHIDPETKTMDIGRMLNVSKSTSLEELKLCQLLCRDCHIRKSKIDNGVPHGGGLTGKRNCRCELCAPLKNSYAREVKRKKRLASLV